MSPPTETSERLIAIADALRRGDEIEGPVRAWMKVVTQNEIEAALPLVEDEPNVERAVVRIALARGWNLGTLSGFAELRKFKFANEAKKKSVPPRDDPKVNGKDPHEGPLPDAFASGAVPDDEAVTGYVLRGALVRYVEGVAARNRRFADELAACIDGLVEAGETIDEAARRWKASFRPDGAVPATPQEAPANVVPLRSAENAPARSTWTSYLAPIALAATVVLVATGAFVFQQSAKQADADRARALQAQRDAEQLAELQRLMQDLQKQNDAIASAQSEAAMAKNEAEREAAKAKLMAAQEQQRKTQANVAAVRAGGGSTSAAGAGGGAGKGKPKPACTCQAGDPLCACL